MKRIILVISAMSALAGCASSGPHPVSSWSTQELKAASFCQGTPNAAEAPPHLNDMSIEQRQTYVLCLRQSVPEGSYKKMTAGE